MKTEHWILLGVAGIGGYWIYEKYFSPSAATISPVSGPAGSVSPSLIPSMMEPQYAAPVFVTQGIRRFPTPVGANLPPVILTAPSAAASVSPALIAPSPTPMQGQPGTAIHALNRDNAQQIANSLGTGATITAFEQIAGAPAGEGWYYVKFTNYIGPS